MSAIMTAAAIKNIATPFSNIDEAYFTDQILYWQEYRLKPLLTKDLYDDFIANIGSWPAIQQTLFDDYIQYAMAYGVTYLAIKKDIITQLSNQGMMNNRTDFSNGSDSRVQMSLKEFAERELQYLQSLGEYLIDNRTTYTDFDWENAVLSLNLRSFLTL